jgi:hypothetical protein
MTIPDHESLLPTGAPAEVPGQSHESTLGFVWRFHRSPPGRGGPGLAHSQGCAALHPGLLSAGPSGTEADSEPNESDLGMKVLGTRFMRLPWRRCRRETGFMGVVVSHPCDKNKYVARVGHPAEVLKRNQANHEKNGRCSLPLCENGPLRGASDGNRDLVDIHTNGP